VHQVQVYPQKDTASDAFITLFSTMTQAKIQEKKIKVGALPTN
jgi:hypothetical protein